MVEPQPRQTLLNIKPRREINQSRNLYLQWRVAELFSSIFSCLGIVSATADYENSFSIDRSHSNCAENVQQIYRWLTLIFTLVAGYFLILRHYIKSKWNNKRELNIKSNEHRRFRRRTKSMFSKGLMFEILILVIFPYPYLVGHVWVNQPLTFDSNGYNDNTIELCYNVSEFLYVLMYIRLWFLLRALFNFTPYQDDHARYYCGKTGTKANVRFSIRCMMKTHPFVIIYCFSFPSFFLLGIFLRVFERPFSDVSGQNFASYQNAVWNCAITMSTVGYGDLFPTTIFGRMVGVLCTMWGAFVFSMIVFTFQSLLELGTRQSEAFKAIKETRTSARVITACLLYSVYKKKFGAESVKARIQMKKVEIRLNKYKTTMKNLKKLDNGGEEESPIHKLQLLSKQVQNIELKINQLMDGYGK